MEGKPVPFGQQCKLFAQSSWFSTAAGLMPLMAGLDPAAHLIAMNRTLLRVAHRQWRRCVAACALLLVLVSFVIGPLAAAGLRHGLDRSRFERRWLFRGEDLRLPRQFETIPNVHQRFGQTINQRVVVVG
jgi:hypothetical protein